MAQVIKIKRSTGSAAPQTLDRGELAYSKGSDTFYIGDPAADNAPIVIGPAIKNNAGTPQLATGVTAEEIRTLIGVDAAGTDNSTNVTLAGTPDYLTLSGQVITLNAIDLTTDVTGTLPVANGGTGATSLAGIKQALDLEIGTDVLAYDANLQSFVTTFELPVADGTSGQVLKTDGAGNLDFVTVSFDDVDVSEANLRARLADLTENVTIGDAEDVTVTITGNLIVSGTTTTLNTTELLVEDNIITLNSGATGVPVANAGIEIERGDSTNTAIRWNETSNVWEFTNDGTSYNVIGYGDITGVSITSTDNSITGTGTGTEGSLSFDLEVGTLDGGTYP